MLYIRNTSQQQRQPSQYKGLEKGFTSKWTQETSWSTILISNKVGFQLKAIKRDREGHFTLIKGTIYQEGITILNIYVPNERAPTFIKERLLKLKSHTDPPTLIVGNIKTPFSPMDRSLTRELNRKITKLTEVITQMDLTDIHRKFYPNTE